MTISVNPQLVHIGKTIGTMAAVGAATGMGATALLGSIDDPTTRDHVRTGMTVAMLAGVVAFYLTPGLPARPFASGAIVGAIAGLTFARDASARADAALGASAVQ